MKAQCSSVTYDSEYALRAQMLDASIPRYPYIGVGPMFPYQAIETSQFRDRYNL
ncbi:predicted protein [Botrytis cinerea T4]|uniref:Uncharacterized protein n=1 Tax=Botryotinia fuckeliana (strain T4) TaxID=999810 RepID=G2Y8E4_BOTF4|nr:predicted protein [Botrytis cinerea T4]